MRKTMIMTKMKSQSQMMRSQTAMPNRSEFACAARAPKTNAGLITYARVGDT